MSDTEPHDSNLPSPDDSDPNLDPHQLQQDIPASDETEEPIMATLVASDDGEEIRIGSPFAQDPDDLPVVSTVSTPRKPEIVYDVGPLKYTAIGSVAAAVMTLAFGAAAAWWFPGGGTLIAGLGCMLSIFGLYSPHKIYASICLAMHLTLFLASYTHAILV